MRKNYYEILGVLEDASLAEIKTAYKKLSKKNHPDVSTEKNAEAKYKKIVTAYETLSDEVKRNKYNKKLEDARKQDLEEKEVVKEKSNETTKLFLILAILVAGIMAIVLIAGSNQKSEEVLAVFNEKLNNADNQLIYIGRPTCSYCGLLEPSLEEMAERYEFDYLYVNTDELGTSHSSEIMAKIGKSSVGTPYMAIVSNGEVVAEQEGYTDYDYTFKFLQENDIIADEEVLNLKYINIDEYKQLLASPEKSIVVVGQSTCSYCVEAKLVLNDINEKYGTEINYLNTSYIETEEQFNELTSSIDYFSTEWGTPVTLILQNGQMIDVLEGLQTEEEYVDFFEGEGVINE